MGFSQALVFLIFLGCIASQGYSAHPVRDEKITENKFSFTGISSVSLSKEASFVSDTPYELKHGSWSKIVGGQNKILKNQAKTLQDILMKTKGKTFHQVRPFAKGKLFELVFFDGKGKAVFICSIQTSTPSEIVMHEITYHNKEWIAINHKNPNGYMEVDDGMFAANLLSILVELIEKK